MAPRAADNIVLAGFMGAGKTTVGKILAEELGWRLTDTDELVEREAGLEIKEIFRRQGEARFRELESKAIGAVAQGKAQVIATGGGALLREENARRLRAAGPIVCLQATPETILARTSDSDARPLLKGHADVLAAITERLKAREEAYARADHHVATDKLSPLGVAIRVAHVTGVTVRPQERAVRINVGGEEGPAQRSYEILIGSGVLARAGEVAEELELGETAAVVTSKNVADRYLAPLREALEASGRRVAVLHVPVGERSKSLRQATRLYDGLLEAGADRSSAVFALGGGMIGDLAGFVAATYMRGIAFVQAPTTLLAQVDASVGGKVVVNHPRAKNIVGAFHQPRAVLTDIDTLRSLRRRDVAAGMAEVIKHGAIADERLFDFTRDAAAALLGADAWGLQYAVHRSCEIKGWFVEVDEFDEGPRALLNFGHTIGHGLEQATGYGRLRHGEAVALGMIAEARLGEELGVTAAGCAEALRETAAAYGLPTTLADLDAAAVLRATARDKKTVGGSLKFSLLERIGAGRTHVTVPQDAVRASLNSILGPGKSC